MLGSLLRKFDNYYRTCPITNVENRCVTFIRDIKYIHCLDFVKEDIWLIAPTSLKNRLKSTYLPTVNIHYTDWPEFEFTIFHNAINKNEKKQKPLIGDDCNIHPTVIMDVDGLKLVHSPNGEKIQFIHTGVIMIGDNVEIGPYTVIHRGTMGCTCIRESCKIGAKNNIGHNCILDDGTVLAVGVILNGGVITGKNCWFSSGSMVKHYTKIVDNTVIGMGAVVTKNITEPGIYIGNPAKFLKPVEGGWNF